MATNWIKQKINIPTGTKFYAAIGPYRSLGSTPSHIERCFDSYEEAWEYIEKHSISEDGKSIFIKMYVPNALFESSGYVEIFQSSNGNFWTYVIIEEE